MSTMPRTPSVLSLFLAWVCFGIAFSTVFQALLTKCLIELGYKQPIQNMDELFSSRIQLGYPDEYNYFFQRSDETEATKSHKRPTYCPSYDIGSQSSKNQKNNSVLISDISADIKYAFGDYVRYKSEPLVCKLDDRVVLTSAL